MNLKHTVKQILGELPFTAEAYWALRQNGKPLSESFSLRRTNKRLPGWIAALEQAPPMPPGKRILLFATLRYWIEHAVLLGMGLAGLGHHVTLAYLPYANWRKPLNRFDQRRHNAYARKVLAPADAYLHPRSLLDIKISAHSYPYQLPAALVEAVERVAARDVQYTLQIEDVDRTSELYRLRLERNALAARMALDWLQVERPEVVLTPNGSILEMGSVYQVARYLDIPVVTYEFGEQRDRIWLSYNAEVMRQDTEALWQERKHLSLDDAQWQHVRELFASRQRADLWQNFSRRWQGQPSQGGEQARLSLGLDSRPIVLLAANVIGDSLTLGRQVFTDSMTAWLQKTVLDFARRTDAQLVVRIHPGERYTKGPSVADVVRQVLPELPEHIHLVAAADPMNTYDLVEIADLGLVYTTTVGMEMAMSGVPVLVLGQTHYRAKGFTLDPGSWQEYTNLLERALKNPQEMRLSRSQVELAWTYAYRFFFDYPQPFPWHLLHFWNELEEWPLERVLSAEGRAEFGKTFNYLAGERIEWHTNLAADGEQDVIASRN